MVHRYCILEIFPSKLITLTHSISTSIFTQTTPLSDYTCDIDLKFSGSYDYYVMLNGIKGEPGSILVDPRLCLSKTEMLHLDGISILTIIPKWMPTIKNWEPFFKSFASSEFKARTDRHSSQWLMKSEKGRLARWALSMSEFNYEIIHRAGKVNVNADVASRWTKELPDVTWNPFPYYADPITRLANPSEKEVCVNCMSFADCSRRHVLTIGILKGSIKETAVLQQKNLVDLIVEPQKIPKFKVVIFCVQNGTLITSGFTKRY